METQTAGQAHAAEFGLLPGTTFAIMLAFLVDSEEVDKLMDFAAIPFASQVYADTWRHEIEALQSMKADLGDQPFLNEMQRVIRGKIERILNAFGGSEPSPEIHELTKQKCYCDHAFACLSESLNEKKET